MVFYQFQTTKLFYERYSFFEQMKIIEDLIFSYFYHNSAHSIINISLVYYMS